MQNRSDFFSSVQVRVSDWAESPVQCLTESDNGTLYKEVARVIPYALPSRVAIDLKMELEEDKEHEVTCWVDDVAPLKYVMLSVTRGGEIFLSRTYEGDTRRDPQNLTETFKFTASRSDNLEDFACQVTLNLTRVPNTTVSSSPVTVRTYALPENPRITAEEWIEHGTVTDIGCDVLRAFPTENITTTLSVDGFPDTEVHGHVAAASALNTSDLPPARHNVLCVSQVFNFSKQSNKNIVIYEPPKINLTTSGREVNVGATLTVTCNIIQGNAEYFGLSVSVDGVEVKRENFPDLATEINVTRRQPNLSVICEMFIRENNKVLQVSEENLTVRYPPEFTNRTCPGSVVWVEGEKRIFGCRSDGNPTPEEECILNTLSLQSSTSFTAARNMSGVYTCRASNSMGNATKSVEVTVQYPPGHPTVNISSSLISTGGSVNLTCYSDALPPPMYKWEIPPHAQVAFSIDKSSITITEASSYHSGVYTCQVENQHGKLSEQQSLEVKRDHTVLLAVLLVVGFIALSVLVGAIVYYFLCRNGKKGFYDLVRLKASKHADANVPLQENSVV
ncbi:PREDICTED: intercellular adhesion molecule 5-like [Nanorana parkeri]|uniref:intercellular adhesion molecule 5-like n=1 Tax=Nanorana parkeri TaxID=125878 RepID=UPI0008543808|nr:PREDICTED: intercellular adhesion molecule 5-like [Nanorana parkeri]